MVQRRGLRYAPTANMTPFLTSPALAGVPGVVHAFTARSGGVSPEPFASLNMGLTFGGGDDVANIRANRARVAHALGLERLAGARQVHSTTVVEASDLVAGQTEADAVVVRTPGVGAMVLVADCVPVLMAASDGSVAAAVHAGWRGAVSHICAAAVGALGTSDVQVAVGPSIGPCCFEVGPEVVEAATAVAGASVVSTGPRGRPHVDLWAVVRADLQAAGVLPERINVLAVCTVCDGRFFSHRGSGGNTGRQAGVVGLVAPAR